MSRAQQMGTVALALVSGFLGGTMSSQFLAGTPAFAEKPSQETRVIRAEKFELTFRSFFSELTQLG